MDDPEIAALVAAGLLSPSALMSDPRPQPRDVVAEYESGDDDAYVDELMAAENERMLAENERMLNDIDALVDQGRDRRATLRALEGRRGGGVEAEAMLRAQAASREAAEEEAIMRMSAAETYEDELVCHSVAVGGREQLEVGGKIVLPESVLHLLSGSWGVDGNDGGNGGDAGNGEGVMPWMFRVTNSGLALSTHCTVSEFTADPGQVWVPFWRMEQLFVEEGDRVHVRRVRLPRATGLTLKTHSSAFAQVYDPKAVLEDLFRGFGCLTVGDIVQVTVGGETHKLTVMDAQPASALGGVCIIDTDVEVDLIVEKSQSEIDREIAAKRAAERAAREAEEEAARAAEEERVRAEEERARAEEERARAEEERARAEEERARAEEERRRALLPQTAEERREAARLAVERRLGGAGVGAVAAAMSTPEPVSETAPQTPEEKWQAARLAVERRLGGAGGVAIPTPVPQTAPQTLPHTATAPQTATTPQITTRPQITTTPQTTTETAQTTTETAPTREGRREAMLRAALARQQRLAESQPE